MRKFWAVLCTVLLLSAAACGSSDDDKAKANIKASVLKDNASVAGGSKLTDKQASCFADGLVDKVGVDKLKKYKLIDSKLQIIKNANPTNMSADDADATAGVITSCVDMTKLITDQINSSAQTKLTAAQTKCIQGAINEDAIKKGLSSSFQGKSDNPMADMQGALMKCVLGGSNQ
ncbi:MAG: hypothetical protein QOK15_250 [Nocardioidaceae bacterium]|jgi:hypothetical protein|nr:hypothetical protein [Nocardioidaceae bacterium]